MRERRDSPMLEALRAMRSAGRASEVVDYVRSGGRHCNPIHGVLCGDRRLMRLNSLPRALRSAFAELADGSGFFWLREMRGEFKTLLPPIRVSSNRGKSHSLMHEISQEVTWGLLGGGLTGSESCDCRRTETDWVSQISPDVSSENRLSEMNHGRVRPQFRRASEGARLCLRHEAEIRDGYGWDAAGFTNLSNQRSISQITCSMDSRAA
jgi:hypothetical protein